MSSSVLSTGTDLLPVIDLAGLWSPDLADRMIVAKAIDEACSDIGFFLIEGHGVDAGLVERMVDVTAAFFAQPDSVKSQLVSATGSHYRGWSMTEDGGDPPVRVRESFEVGRWDSADDIAAAGYDRDWIEHTEPNIWPADAEFVVTWKEYYASLQSLAERLNEAMALALGLPEDWFSSRLRRQTSYLSGNLYPAQPRVAGARRLGAHSDIGILTILWTDQSTGGLEVLDRSDVWRPVTAWPGSFVVNLGDMLAQWTNDRWRATQHRVVNPDSESAGARLSIPFFQHPDFDALLECIPSCTSAVNPPKYPPVLAGEWSRHRMATY